jgi:hypothetical protein
MSEKIVGVTVGTPLNPEVLKDKLNLKGSAGYVVQDTAPEDVSVLWVDPTDNSDDGFQEIVSAVIAALPKYEGEVESV